MSEFNPYEELARRKKADRLADTMIALDLVSADMLKPEVWQAVELIAGSKPASDDTKNLVLYLLDSKRDLVRIANRNRTIVDDIVSLA